MSQSFWIALNQVIQDWGMRPAQVAEIAKVPEERLNSALQNVDRATHFTSSEEPTVPSGMENLVPLLAIHQRLKSRFPDDLDAQTKWLFTSNPDFGGAKPIDVMASSETNLMWVGYYLDSSRA